MCKDREKVIGRSRGDRGIVRIRLSLLRVKALFSLMSSSLEIVAHKIHHNQTPTDNQDSSPPLNNPSSEFPKAKE